jgi:hypothetical protein
LPDSIDIDFRRFDSRLRFLLKGVNHHKVNAELRGKDDAIGVAAMLERYLKYPAVDALEGLGPCRLWPPRPRSSAHAVLRAARRPGRPQNPFVRLSAMKSDEYFAFSAC